MNIRKFLYDNHWTLGFIKGDIAEQILHNDFRVHWMHNPYKDRWFADPFILDVTEDDIIVLVEEFYDPIQRGRISRLIIDAHTYQLKSVDPVLELPTHLSFPAIIRIKGDIYIYPENSAGNELSLYKYDTKTNVCKKVKRIIDKPLTDAIITCCFNREMIFTTCIPHQNGNLLQVYENQDGEFKLRKEMSFPSNIARNAGDWFCIDGKVYRPAQNCNIRYGGSMILQEVTRDEDNYYFRDVCEIKLSHKSYKLGCHTFNHYKGLSVVDVNGYRRPFAAAMGLLFVRIRQLSAKIRRKWKRDL